MSKKEPQFVEDEICWAKVRGFPWWPAIITECLPTKTSGEHKYDVNFFCDKTHSVVVESKL